MKIVATSDFHGRLPSVPECDLLLIAGDVCPDCTLFSQLDWLNHEFRSWLYGLKARMVIGIAGNHDFIFEKRPGDVAALGLPWVYLQDSSFEFEGIKVHGVPWVPNLSRWAFHLDEAGLDRKFNAIPTDTDIILSHGPPHMRRDRTCPRYGDVHVGSDQLNVAIERVKPKAVVCGHIHEAFGRDGVVYNVSLVDENYDPIHEPVTIDV